MRSIAHYVGPPINQTGVNGLSTPTLFGQGWGRQQCGHQVGQDTPQVSNMRSIAHYTGPNMNQTGVHGLSTPTLFGKGWGRQTVETELVNIWTGVVCEAISIRTV